MSRVQSTDEKAIRRLIRRYTAKRDWTMVRALFRELGIIFTEEVS